MPGYTGVDVFLYSVGTRRSQVVWGHIGVRRGRTFEALSGMECTWMIIEMLKDALLAPVMKPNWDGFQPDSGVITP